MKTKQPLPIQPMARNQIQTFRNFLTILTATIALAQDMDSS